MSSSNSNQDLQGTGDGGSSIEASGTKQKQRSPRPLTEHRRLKILQFIIKNCTRYSFEDTTKLEWQAELLSFLEELPGQDVRIFDVVDWLTRYPEFFRKAFGAASGILEPIDPLSGDSSNESSGAATDEPPMNLTPPTSPLPQPVQLPFQIPSNWTPMPEELGPGQQHLELFPWRNPSDILLSSYVPPRQAPGIPQVPPLSSLASNPLWIAPAIPRIPSSRPPPAYSAPSQQGNQQRLVLLNPSAILNQTSPPTTFLKFRINPRPSPYPQSSPQTPARQQTPLGSHQPSPQQAPSGSSTRMLSFGSFEQFLQTFAGNPSVLPANQDCVKSTAKILIGMLENALMSGSLTPEVQEEYEKFLKSILSFTTKLEGEGQAPSAAGNA